MSETSKQSTEAREGLPWSFLIFEAVVYVVAVGVLFFAASVYAAAPADCETALYESPAGRIFRARTSGTWVDPSHDPAERSAHAVRAASEYDTTAEAQALAARAYPHLSAALRKLAYIERADHAYLSIRADREAAHFLAHVAACHRQ